MRKRREAGRGRAPDQSERPAITDRTHIGQGALSAGRALTPMQALALQGTAGNAAVVQRIAQDKKQDKKQEKNQDQQGRHGAGCGQGCGHTPSVQRSSVTNVISTPGTRFDGPMRKEAESVYGVDLSHLRVHTDASARQSAQEVGAEAYTSGTHMVFDGAMTRSKVLHEVAHTFQQAAGPVSGHDNGNGLSVSDPHSPEERQAAAMENAGAPSAGLQRLISSSAAPAEASAGAAPVQRVFGLSSRRSERRHTQQDSDRIEAGRRPRTHGSTRAGTSSSRRDRDDPMTQARRAPLPTRGPQGEQLWNGVRNELTWLPGVEDAVLASTYSEYSSSAQANRYACQKCQKMVFSKRVAKKAKKDNWYEIDHKEGILAYVHRSVDPIDDWPVPVADNVYRLATGIRLTDARAAANHTTNLRVLCKGCNGGSRAANSESRHMDRNPTQWVGEPYALDDGRRSASPERGYADPAPMGNAYVSGGVNIVNAGPGGPSGYGGYSGYSGGGGPSGYGGYDGGYDGGQPSNDPGYDVVDVEPRRRY
ncbi:DUF4157 domain-containing protein [Streptomyces sp. CWNU-52B]|uniref:eCIS core domain-containing protein n=1 Tax=unclassified Streptomyces TaxID=2593676 RepID=UPI0039C09149